MSDDKYKNIPTLDDIIHAGDLNKAVIGDLNPEPESRLDEPDVEDIAEHGFSSSPETASDESDNESADDTLAETITDNPDAGYIETPAEDRRITERRIADRRVSSQPLPAGEVMTERRNLQRRESDKQQSPDLDRLVEHIMQDMMPDLEQHIRLQLRFELEKHLPRMVSESKDRDTD